MTTQFVAVINTPGYQPQDDDPPVFDAAQEAWLYLADERARGEDESDELAEYSEIHQALVGLSEDPSAGTGTVYGDTPGYDGSHDLGLAYCVVIAEESANDE